MSVIVQPRPLGLKSEGQSGSIGYVAIGGADLAEVGAAVLAAAPETLETHAGILPRGQPRIEEISVDSAGEPNLWDVEVPYGATRSRLVIPSTGTTVWSGDTTGGTQHVTHSLSHRSYAREASVVFELPGSIGATKDGVGGVDVVRSNYSFQATKYIPESDFDTTFRRALRTLTGKLNDASWTANGDTFEAGEVLFLGATWARRSTVDPADWEVNFKFAANPNLGVADIEPIGSIFFGDDAVIGGWDFVDVRFEDVESGDTLVKDPVFVLVHQVYRNGDFSDLELS